jgi:rfaE bifunctional protein nucleotidyltransferase chain/domain
MTGFSWEQGTMESSVVRLERKPWIATGPRDKIRTIEELGVITQRLRQAGETVVQAHGTFDLLHLGHVRHLEAASSLGDVLVVTVTGDRFVNKGPGRPAFSDGLRAEMLAALQCVDWVAICQSPDAVKAIEFIRPNIYVKGQDYQDPERDITGKIKYERQAVEENGGRLHCTDELVFSSTELVNRYFNIFGADIRVHLDALRANDGLNEIINLVESVRDRRVVLVGDAIIDEYQYVLPIGKPPKEHIIATRFQDQELFAGGVFAAANHVASYCAEVDVITSLGASESYEDLIRRSLLPNVRLHAVNRPDVPTTLKQRLIDPSSMRKLFEVCYMNDESLTANVQEEFDKLITQVALNADVVIVTDFGHGLVGPSSIELLSSASRFLAVNTQSNSANLGYNLITKYPRADYVCVDEPEARLAVGDRVSKIDDIARMLSESHIDCAKIIITHGKNGCVTFDRSDGVHRIPAFARKVIDTMGAGDAFLSITAPLVAAGGSMHNVGFIGNIAGAMKVEIVGHRRFIDKPTLIKGVKALLA